MLDIHLLVSYLIVVDLLACLNQCGTYVISHVRLSATPWTIVHEVPLAMEFSSQEYCSGLPFPTSGDLPNPEIKSAISCISCIGRQVLYH